MQIHRYFKLSVGVALATISLKTAAWWWTGSVGLLSDAMESFVNLAAAVFGLWMVTVAARPADDDHPFGHAKAEYFSSGFEGLLILGAATAMAVAAVLRCVATAAARGARHRRRALGGEFGAQRPAGLGHVARRTPSTTRSRSRPGPATW